MDLHIRQRGTRITPRTCLWPLAGSLVVTFSLSIGLTFRSNHYCFAGTCGEWLFPLQARLHVVIWYAWISISVTFFAVRAFHPQMQKFFARNLFEGKLSVINKYITIGGALEVLWILTLYGVIVGVWWIRLRDYFVDRGNEGGIYSGGHRLAAIALTGHLCDVTMGMVLLPISRHSALASFFKLSPATTLTHHMLTAYTLFCLVLVHGFIYISWLPVFNSLSAGLRKVIPVLNPTYLYNETWPGNRTSLGVWRASLIFTGLVASTIMLSISITTLPSIRSNHFNLFYFTHLLSIIMVIIICLHASTIFYCTAPGLAMWCLDWGMRLYELRKMLDGDITTLGNGWYCVTLPLPRARLAGCSCKSPLAHFYIHHADSSIRELHPFTTITHLLSQHLATHPQEDSFPIQFIFRKRGKTNPVTNSEKSAGKRFVAIFTLFRKKSQQIRSTQWTDKLASIIDDQQYSKVICPRGDNPRDADTRTSTSLSFQPLTTDESLFPKIKVSLRLEGPYFSPADPSRYKTTVCLVAGTGITGAVAIAGAFSASNASSKDRKEVLVPIDPSKPITVLWQNCIIIWSVRATDHAELPFWDKSSGVEVQTYLTGGGRKRVDVLATLQEIRKRDMNGRIWVYISGPKPFMVGAEEACKGVEGLDVYAPSWDV